MVLPGEAVLMATSVNTHDRPRSRSLAMAFCDKEYFEKIGELQMNMHKSEKRRFQLERELLAFCTSDKQGSETKNAKLRCYLRQICERENRAKARNLELLRHMESVELHLKALCFNHSALREKKGKVFQGSAASDCSSRLATGLYQPAAIFMGRHTSRSLPVETGSTKAAAVRPSCTEPDGLSYLPERPGGATLKNPRLPKNRTVGLAVADSPIRPSGSDAGSATFATSLLDFTPLASGPRLNPEQLSPSATAMASEEEALPASGIRREGAGTSPAEGALGGLSGDEESDSPDRSPVSASGGKQEDALDSESLPSPSAEKSPDLALSSGSDLPLSLSEGNKDPAGFQEDSARASACDLKTGQPPGAADRDDEPAAAASRHTAANTHEESKGVGESEVGRGSRRARMSSVSKAMEPMLSLEGFFHLLESIEERLDEREKKAYRISSVSEQRLSYLIRLCNREASLSGEDLEACGAVALHQLQRLSWNTPEGCLLPREVLAATWTGAAEEEGRVRSCLSPEGARLWDRWFRHAVALRERGAFTADGIARLFAPLLVEKGASSTDKAEEILSVLLEYATGDAVSASGDESSGSLPSLLFDGGEIKAARPARCRETFTHGQQSGEEDSQEESFVESIPIRETKAYQLLKQSAAQHRAQSPREEDEDELDAFPSGVTHDHHVEYTGNDERARKSSSLFTERPLVGAGKVAKTTVPAVQSKAFWGESDDSNSDIEAALRPQSRGTAVDDFDSFDD